MQMVRTLRRHDNPYGRKYRKLPGDRYQHPDPAQAILDGLVVKVVKRGRRWYALGPHRRRPKPETSNGS